MAPRQRSREFQKVVIDYPPVPTKKWKVPRYWHVPNPYKRKPIERLPIFPYTRRERISTLEKIWHAYKIIDRGIALLCGDIAQYDVRFPMTDRGKIGPAACFAAIGLSRLLDMSLWIPSDLNKILHVGHRLYRFSTLQYRSGCTCTTPREIYNTFYIDNNQIVISADTQIVKGHLTDDSELKAQLRDSFEISKNCILEIGGKFIACMKIKGSYYLYDPNDRDRDGFRVKDGQGVATLFKFLSYGKLIYDIMMSYADREMDSSVGFSITPMLVQKCIELDLRAPDPEEMYEIFVGEEKEVTNVVNQSCLATKMGKKAKKAWVPVIPPIPPAPGFDQKRIEPGAAAGAGPGGLLAIEGEQKSNTPSLGAITDIDRINEMKRVIPADKPKVPSVTYFKSIPQAKYGGGIIQGTIHQNDPTFSRYPGKQSLANAIAAIAMIRKYRPKYWYPKIIDEILRTGEAIYLDSKKNFSGDNTLTVRNLTKKFKLNKKFYTPVIQEVTIRGRLNSAKLSILDLKPALEEFFIENPACIIRGPTTTAFFYDDCKYYMFDPNERDKTGHAIDKTYKAQNGNEVISYEPGAACLVYFKNLEELVALYMSNLTKVQRRELFIISKVVIKDYVEELVPYCNFTCIKPGRWILRGTISQNNPRFGSDARNHQGTAIATMALMFQILQDVKHWERSTIDEIVIEGNAYHKQCVAAAKEKGKYVNKLLNLLDMVKRYTIHEKDVVLYVEECYVNGLVYPHDDPTVPNLEQGLKLFFSDSDAAVITSRNISISVWRGYDQFYYYFDSHMRDEEGHNDYAGLACVMRFSDLADLSSVIMGNLGVSAEDTYNIGLVEFSIWERTLDGFPKPAFYNFVELESLKGIIRASSHQDDPEVFDCFAGRQTLCMLLAPFGMAYLIDTNQWTTQILDEIMQIGQKFYLDSRVINIKRDLLASNQWTVNVALDDQGRPKKHFDNVTHDNITYEYRIGANKVTFRFGAKEEAPFEMEETEEEQEDAKSLQTILHKHLEAKNDVNSKNEILIESEFLDVALWKDQNVYYLFDPRGRDPEGNVIGREQWSAKYIPPEENENLDESNELLMDDAVALTEPVAPVVVPVERHEGMMEDEGEGEDGIVALYARANPDDKKACVIMFSQFEDVLYHILENVPPNSRKDKFAAYTVNVKVDQDVQPSSNPPARYFTNWYNFTELNVRRWIIRGNIDMHNQLFPEMNRGKQYASMCIAGCVYCRLYAIPKFESWTIDLILKYGDKLHSAIRKNREKKMAADPKSTLTDAEIRALAASEEIKPVDTMRKFYQADYLVNLSINPKVVEGDISKDLYDLRLMKAKLEPPAAAAGDGKMGKTPSKMMKRESRMMARESRMMGVTGSKMGVTASRIGRPKKSLMGTPQMQAQDDPAEKVFGIRAGLQEFFNFRTFGIVNVKGACFAVFKIQDYFYMFDPDTRGPEGVKMPDGVGVACLTRYLTLEDLAVTLEKNLPKDGGNKYTIDEVIISTSPANRPAPAVSKVILTNPKMTAFGEIGPGKMILRGNFHQNNPKFNLAKSAMDATNAIVALAMEKIHQPRTWTKLIVDEVLLNAYRLYKKSIVNLEYKFNPWEDKMTIDLVNRNFNVGVNDVTWCILCDDVRRGQLVIKSSEVFNLRRALEDFFLEHNQGIIESPHLTTAIWIDNDIYYMFDPNPRGPTGIYTSGGKSCLLIFKGIGMMTEHFLLNIPSEYHSEEFIIYPIEMKICEHIKEEKKPHPISKRDILKITEIDSEGEEKKKRKRSKSSKNLPKTPLCRTVDKSKRMPCYCPQKHRTTIAKTETNTSNLMQFSPEQKKEWARQKSEAKKLLKENLIEYKMRQCFYTLENGDAILRARYSQNSEKFSEFTRNLQSIPNALIALVMLKIHDPSTWSYANLEIILDSADVLYKDSYTIYKPTNPKLGLRNILRTFYILNLKVSSVIYKPVYAGRCIYEDLYRALLNFFMNDFAAILLSESLTVAVFQKSGAYYMFDPHDRNNVGLRCPRGCLCLDPKKNKSGVTCYKGCACLMRFQSLENLVEKYLLNMEGNSEDIFSICPVKIVSITKSKR